MKKINFKNLYLSYFLSTGEKTELDYKDGIFFVRGDNQTVGQNKQNNGVGKTAIFLDGLVYALYGETSRKLKKSEIPFNKGGKRKCIVQLKFEIEDGEDTKEVKILRTINPSKFTLYVDGEDISNSNASATQEHLVKELLGGIKREVFQHSIAMKVNSTIPFMSMSKVDRDKFIGGIFDLSYLKECEKLAREEFNTCSKNVGKQEARLNEAIPNLKRVEDQITTLQEQEEQKKKERLIKISSLEEEIKSVVIGECPEEIDFDEKDNLISEALDKLSVYKKKLVEKEEQKRLKEQEEKLEEIRIKNELEQKGKDEEQKKQLELQKKKLEELNKKNELEQKLKDEEQKRELEEVNRKNELLLKETTRNNEIERLEKEVASDKESMSCSKCGRDFDEESKKKIQESIVEKEQQIIKLKDE